MRKTIFAVILCLTTACFATSSNAEEGEPDYGKISALLFPESSSWQLVLDMKRADAMFLNKIKQELRKAYAGSKISKEYESENCSFIERVLSKEWNFPKNFYLHDIDGDGIQDILYTGSTQCAEGDSTLVWFGRKDKPKYEIRQDVFWPMLTIRINQGKQAGFTSVSTGCCGSITDEYFSGNLAAMRKGGIKSITSNTELPKQTLPSVAFATGKEMVLRSTPMQNDKYDEIASEITGGAVFGNVLSKYLPGCTGDTYSKQTDQNSESWCFVTLSKGCNPLRSHAAYGVNTGWTNCDSLNVK